MPGIRLDPLVDDLPTWNLNDVHMLKFNVLTWPIFFIFPDFQHVHISRFHCLLYIYIYLNKYGVLIAALDHMISYSWLYPMLCLFCVGQKLPFWKMFNPLIFLCFFLAAITTYIISFFSLKTHIVHLLNLLVLCYNDLQCG